MVSAQYPVENGVHRETQQLAVTVASLVFVHKRGVKTGSPSHLSMVHLGQK